MSLYYKIILTILIIGCSVVTVSRKGFNDNAKTREEKKLHKICISIYVVAAGITMLALIAGFIGFV